MSADIKMYKTNIYEKTQSGVFLGVFLSRIASQLANNILPTLGVTPVASEIDAGIQNKIHGSGKTSLISNEEMNDTIKVVKLLNILMYL